MKLRSAAYCIIHRHRKRNSGIRIDTRKRTVEVPYLLEHIPSPIVRLRDEFGFVLQQYVTE